MSFIPFNQRPTNTDYSTNYTPTTGKYARITPRDDAGSNLVINGDIVWYHNIYAESIIHSNPSVFSLPSHGIWDCQIIRTTTAGNNEYIVTLTLTDLTGLWTIDLAAFIPTATSQATSKFEALGSQQISLTSVHVGQTYKLVSKRIDKSQPVSFWVNTGDVVTGNFYYEEYTIN